MLLLIAVVGYDLIHNVSKVISVISGVAFVLLTVNLVSHLGSVPTGGHTAWQNVLLAISIFIAWQITWAPYVSDYSRYLPHDTSMAKTFWYTFIGSAVGSSWSMLIGAFAVLVGGNAFGANSIGYLAGRFPGIGTLLFAALLLSLVPAGAEGPYGAFLTGLASITERGVGRTNGTKVRVAFMTVFTIIATILAIAASSNLLTTFENITLFLLYLLVPWTAINLTDYYIVRRGDYDVPEFFKRTGLYGFLNVRAVVLYLVAIVVEIPFINSSLYEGPIAKQMGGADISWIVGLVVSAVGYYMLVHPSRREPKTLVTGE